MDILTLDPVNFGASKKKRKTQAAFQSHQPMNIYERDALYSRAPVRRRKNKFKRIKFENFEPAIVAALPQEEREARIKKLAKMVKDKKRFRPEDRAKAATLVATLKSSLPSATQTQTPTTPGTVTSPASVNVSPIGVSGGAIDVTDGGEQFQPVEVMDGNEVMLPVEGAGGPIYDRAISGVWSSPTSIPTTQEYLPEWLAHEQQQHVQQQYPQQQYPSTVEIEPDSGDFNLPDIDSTPQGVNPLYPGSFDPSEDGTIPAEVDAQVEDVFGAAAKPSASRAAITKPASKKPTANVPPMGIILCAGLIVYLVWNQSKKKSP